MRDFVDKAEEHILTRIRDSLESSQIPERNDLIKQILESEKIFIYGVGRSGLMAKAFAIRLVQLGLKNSFLLHQISKREIHLVNKYHWMETMLLSVHLVLMNLKILVQHISLVIMVITGLKCKC